VIVLHVPEAARVTINGQVTTSEGTRRLYTSPPLRGDTEYVYTIKVEVPHNGRTLTQTREVLVRAGKTTTATFDFPIVDDKPAVGLAGDRAGEGEEDRLVAGPRTPAELAATLGAGSAVTGTAARGYRQIPG
jgi:uncharacterized protein (TIGR03000 family)